MNKLSMATVYKLIALVALAALIVLVAVISRASAMPSTVTFQTTATATTTVAYLGNGLATSTYQFDSSTFSSGKIQNVQGVDAVSLYLQVAASSTATIYAVTPQFSNNGVDWYGVASSSTNGANAFTAAPTVYTWNPGTTATTSLVFNLPAVPAAHERVVVSASGAAGAVYMEVDLKKNPSNP